MRTKPLLIAVAAALTLVGAACSSSASSSPTSTTTASVTSSPSATAAPGATTAASATTPTPVASNAPPTTTPAGAVNPNGPEVVEPGDIPDNQVFVAYPWADGTFSVKVPEGWARTEQNGAVTFADKYNSIVIQSIPMAAAPTVDSVTATGLSDVSSDPNFVLVDVTPVTRKAGDGVLATYEIGSAPNSVTGKVALLAVERYVFSHNGIGVVLTLSGAKGADNVDPWKIVSDSLSWM